MYSETFKTTNSHLENFLFFHKIRFIRQERTADGTMQWYYRRDQRFIEVYDEYRQLYPERFRRI